MDWLQFFASVTSSLAWPVAVVAVCGLLRNQIGELVKGIRSVEWDKLKITLTEQIAEVSEEVEATVDALPPERIEPPDRQTASIDPRAMILNEWIPVELEVKRLGHLADLSDARSFVGLANQLHVKDYFDIATFRSIMKLRKIRNQAAHLNDRELTASDAIAMANTCRTLVSQLKKIEGPQG